LTSPVSWEDLLGGLSHPQQYVGCEWNTVAARSGLADVALVYPDIYELGASNFGLSVVRHALLRSGAFNVRRAFCPAPDLAGLIESGRSPWRCVEDGFPVASCRVIGFGVPSEALFSNVLFLLRLAGLQTRSTGRRDSDPLILAGGGGISNPLPLSPFVDVFFLGEAEEQAAALFESLSGQGSRQDRLESAAGIPGVWVPALGVKPVELQRVRRLTMEDAPVRQLVPLAQISHDRAVVEIARGCTRGCRFCQATQLTRPVRERPVGDVLELAASCLRQTGWEEAGFLSLSFSDYGDLDTLLAGASNLERELGIAVSKPSLRPDSFARLAAGGRMRGRVTLAPEAGSERLRYSLNKILPDDDILSAADTAFRLGATGIKLYFMIGLPGESCEDLDAMVELLGRLRSVAASRGRRGRDVIGAALSPFVPKPHTPLQWAPQLAPDEVRGRIERICSAIRWGKPGWNDPRLALLEAVLGLGDGHGTADMLEEAVLTGARFDAWSDRFRWDIWEPVLRSGGAFSPDGPQAGRDPSADLPWSFVRAGSSVEFLRAEYGRFLAGVPTPDCREAGCSGCGACRDAGTVGEVATGGLESGNPAVPALAKAQHQPVAVLRIRWGRHGLARFSSHLDMVRLWTRTIRRSGLPAAGRGDFVRRLRVRFGPALPLGFESGAEVLDILLEAVPAPGALAALAAALPQGFEICEGRLLPPGAGAPDAEAEVAEYEFTGAEDGPLREVLSRAPGIVLSGAGADGKTRAMIGLGGGSPRVDRLLSEAGVRVGLIKRTGLFALRGGEPTPLLSLHEGDDLT